MVHQATTKTNSASVIRRSSVALFREEPLPSDTEQQDGSTSDDDLTPTQRELVEEFMARWGWSEEEARYHLRLWGG
jgi:hypothetical protein